MESLLVAFKARRAGTAGVVSCLERGTGRTSAPYAGQNLWQDIAAHNVSWTLNNSRLRKKGQDIFSETQNAGWISNKIVIFFNNNDNSFEN